MRRHIQSALVAAILFLPFWCAAQLTGVFQYPFTNGPALWDFSGSYGVSNETFRVANTLAHSLSGALTGTGGAHYDDGLVRLNGSATLKGRVTGRTPSPVTIKASGTGQFSGNAFGTSLSGPFNASLSLALDPTNRVLSGTETVMVCVRGRGCRTLSTNVSFQLPDNVTGAWTLSLDITTSNNVVRGTATLELSSGRTLAFNVRGRYLPASGISRLTLLGSGESLGRRLAVRLDSTGALQGLNGNLLGQRLVFP